MKTLKYLQLLVALLYIANGDIYAQVASNLVVKDRITESQREDHDILSERLNEISQNPMLTKRGEAHYYRGEYLEAIQFPVGGLGSGCIQFDGSGVARYWQIFNNLTHDFVPNSFMAIKVKYDNRVEVRALQTTDVYGFKGMRELTCRNDFPFLTYSFIDDLPITVEMQVYNPFIPTDLKNSSIPAVFYRINIVNHSGKDVEVDLLSTQQNAVGFTNVTATDSKVSFAEDLKMSLERELVDDNSSSLYGGNYNQTKEIGGAKVLFMRSTDDDASEHFGQMALMLIDDRKQLDQSMVTASWGDRSTWVDRFNSDSPLSKCRSTKPSASGSTYTGAIVSKVILSDGQSKSFDLALAWYFPNGINGGKEPKWDAWAGGQWHGRGNYYATEWSSVDDLANYIVSNHKELYLNSLEFHNTLFSTNFPYWLNERLSSQLSIIKSRTIFHDKDGYVGLWEGCGSGDGSCSGNCNHVWHYAQAHARLFPELARKIRNQTFHFMSDEGLIPYRQPAGHAAFDGQCGDIISAYREHLLSSDDSWLKEHYQDIKKALEFTINSWDSDRDGWLEGRMHNTYDCSMSGNSSFLTSLYLTAIKAAVKMATIVGDSDSAQQWSALLEKGSAVQNERLWNGHYYIQIPDTTARASDYINGCHTDQLLGQWWADQLNLGEIFPLYRTRQAFNSIFKNNFKSTLMFHKQNPREFAKADEPGIVVTTWPGDDRPEEAPGYSDEIFSAHEYNIAASLFKQDQPIDALTLLYAGAMRYDGRLRTDYKGEWGNFGFSGNPFGDDECGQFYSRALSCWSVLLAAQGFAYDGPKGEISFNPKWQSDNHKSLFTASNGWGLFSQLVVDESQINTIDLRFGSLDISSLTLDNRVGQRAPTVKVELDGRAIEVDVNSSSDTINIGFKELNLTKGSQLKIYCNSLVSD